MIKLILFFFLICSTIFSEMKFDSVYKFEKNFTYTLILPKNFNPEKKYHLALGLHGLFGDGSKLLTPFSYYTKFSNMILVCPDGNIADPERKSVKWGYDRSEVYLLELVEHLREKFNLEKEILLFGFSQGANQGLNTALSQPQIFPYFVAISGGYTSLTDKQFSNSKKINLFFLTGDTGEGEIYTKLEVDKRISELSKYSDKIERKTYIGLRHEINFEESYDMINWFYKKINKENPLIEDYYPYFLNSKESFLKGKFLKSIEDSKKVLNLNPNFSPSILNIAKSHFFSNDFSAFKKMLLEALISYSENLYFNDIELIQFFDSLKKTDSDFLNTLKFNPFLINILNEKKIHHKFKAEIHFYLAEVYYAEKNIPKAEFHFLKSYQNFIKLKIRTDLVETKLIYISNFLKDLE